MYDNYCYASTITLFAINQTAMEYRTCSAVSSSFGEVQLKLPKLEDDALEL